MHWSKEEIRINAENHSAIAPIIISASRATDIPAFFAKEFIENLKKGYQYWKNPYNGKESLISLSKTRFVVFWTKNAAPMIPYLDYLDKNGINYYFNYTVNDYQAEGLEEKLPNLKKRIDTFKELSYKVGPEKVIWRYDPLILLKGQNIEYLVQKITNIADSLHTYTNKLVFSFVETNYRKVQINLKRRQVEIETINSAAKQNIAAQIAKYIKPYKLEIATCAEKEDFKHLKINKNKCIDDTLITKIANSDQKLINFINDLKCKNKLKDKSQRTECNCILSKDIGSYNSCYYNCTYCYAGFDKKSGN